MNGTIFLRLRPQQRRGWMLRVKWSPHECQQPRFPSRTLYCNEILNVSRCSNIFVTSVSNLLSRSHWFFIFFSIRFFFLVFVKRKQQQEEDGVTLCGSVRRTLGSPPILFFKDSAGTHRRRHGFFFSFCYYYLFLQHNNAMGITGQIQVKESEVRHSISQFPDPLGGHGNKEILLWGAEADRARKSALILLRNDYAIMSKTRSGQENPTHSVVVLCQRHCLPNRQF